MKMIDEAEIRRTIAIMKPDNRLFEIRLAGGTTASGYFKDAETLLKAVSDLRVAPGTNFYISLNEVKEECYSRRQRNQFITKDVKPTTGDSDVSAYDWLMIDIDPIRAAGTSSSEEQIRQARAKGNEVYRYLKSEGFEEPVVAESGNGVHLLYSVYLANNPDNKFIVKTCLAVLDMFFSDGEVQIDKGNFNPARICKLYGTLAQKGSNTSDRPHRMSRIVKAPATIKQNDKALLQKLAGYMPEPERPQRSNNYNPAQFDLDSWLVEHGLAYTTSSYGDGTKYILDHCPFDANHTKKDACIFKMSSGAIGFKCFHNSCSDKTWRDVRLLFEPEAYDRDFWAAANDVRMPNYQNPNYQVVQRQEVKEEEAGQPVFYTTEQIRLLEEPPEEFIKTGIPALDSKLRGLKKGFVTCMSGLRAAGKSSIISQFTVEAANQGYRTALFSGELTAKNLLKWLVLQAAGKNHVKPTKYENFYVIDAFREEEISHWLDEKVYVYNNYYGNNFRVIMDQLQKCVVDHKVDLIILDNLMTLNISELDVNKYQQQSLFVDRLEFFAKQNNVHVLFVAHPRKSNGFLRLDDVSGSNDIVNRVDNALILHRVNEDFKRLTHDMFKWPPSAALYDCTNVIEICKDRAGGTQDEFIPLYFEPSTKRLRNDRAEYKIYGWERQEDGLPMWT